VERYLRADGPPITVDDNNKFKIIEKAHNKVIILLRHEFHDDFLTIDDAMHNVHDDMLQVLRQILEEHGAYKLMISVQLKLESSKTFEILTRHFHTHFMLLSHPNFVDDRVAYGQQYINNTIDLFNHGESGHVIKRVDRIDLKLARYRGMGAGHLPIPQALRRR